MVRQVSPATAISLSVCMFDAGKEKRFRKREKIFCLPLIFSLLPCRFVQFFSPRGDRMP